MYFMYVDESGDPGLKGSPTNEFILTGLVFHELRWAEILHDLVEFRRFLKRTKGLKIKEEIHAVRMLNRPGKLSRIPRNVRVDILKKCIDWLNTQPVSTFSVVVDKTGKTGDVFEIAWTTLIQRFENTMSRSNFPGTKNADDRGIIISDNTDGQKLKKLVRKMRHYNSVPNNLGMFGGGSRNMKLRFIIEDPVMKDSLDSILHQMVDVVAYCVRQKISPNQYMKNKGGNRFYDRLTNIVLDVVSVSNNDGLVYR